MCLLDVTRSFELVFHRAVETANIHDLDHVGSECVLASLLGPDGQAVLVLSDLKVDIAVLRNEVLELLEERKKRTQADEDPLSSLVYARDLTSAATEEAKEMESDFLHTGHLLLALLRCENSAAARLLANHGVDYEKTKERVLSFTWERNEKARPYDTVTDEQLGKFFRYALVRSGYDNTQMYQLVNGSEASPDYVVSCGNTQVLKKFLARQIRLVRLVDALRALRELMPDEPWLCVKSSN